MPDSSAHSAPSQNIAVSDCSVSSVPAAVSVAKMVARRWVTGALLSASAALISLLPVTNGTCQPQRSY